MIQWDEEEVFASSDEFFAGLLAEIQQAQKSIDFEVYIFELDRLGKRILTALEAAAARGVEVRLMVDGVGSPSWNAPLLKTLEQNKLNARIYRPYPWVKMGLRFYPRMFQFHRLGNLFRKLNRRNHRKVCVIDSKVAWVGSMNVAEKLMRSYASHEAWRETGTRVRGAAVEVLTFAFERAWMMAWAGRPRSFHLRKTKIQQMVLFWKKNTLVRLNLSVYLRNLYYQDLLERLHTAHQRIWITSAYFIPSGSILRALRTAARSGVDVRILVSKKMDVKLVRWVMRVVLSALIEARVRVFEYESRILHAKSMIVDHWAMVGSSNLNHRSLIHDLEVDVVLNRVDSLKDLEKYFIRDLSSAKEMTLEESRSDWSLQKILGRILFFFRYWL